MLWAGAGGTDTNPGRQAIAERRTAQWIVGHREDLIAVPQSYGIPKKLV
jgi:hypothetical protein